MKFSILNILLPILVLALGMGTGWLTNTKDFPKQKKAWQPPGWVFSVVWTVLYLLLGLSLSFAIQQRNTVSIILECTILIILLLWPYIYFTQKSRVGGIIGLSLLLACLVSLLIYLGLHSKWVQFGLLIPLTLWGGFAMSLTA
jgi:tryptophan-rich sensory protein